MKKITEIKERELQLVEFIVEQNGPLIGDRKLGERVKFVKSVADILKERGLVKFVEEKGV